MAKLGEPNLNSNQITHDPDMSIITVENKVYTFKANYLL